MANKFYGQKTFKVALSKDEYIFLHCSTQNTRYGFRHVCDFIAPGDRCFTRAKCCYYNRTWERFKYESVLLEAARKLPPERSAAVRDMIEKVYQDEHAANEKMFNDFMGAWNAAPEGVKNVIANGPAIATPEHAALATGILQAAALLETIK